MAAIVFEGVGKRYPDGFSSERSRQREDTK